MSKTVPADDFLRVRINHQVKKETAAALQEMGLTISEYVRMALKYVAKEKEFPVWLEIPNATTIAAMNEPIESLKSYENIDDFFKEVEAKSANDLSSVR